MGEALSESAFIRSAKTWPSTDLASAAGQNPLPIFDLSPHLGVRPTALSDSPTTQPAPLFNKQPTMQKCQQRARYSCDACAFRRVKCNGGEPCQECCRRSIDCTRLRQRRKRGPKGPRASTVEKIECYKESLSLSTSSPSDTSAAAANSIYEEPVGPAPASWSYANIPGTYHDHLDIFRRRLYTVWPIIDPHALVARLAAAPQDWQAHALAASLCAAVIAQLRLDQRPEPGVNSQAAEFVKEAQQQRKLYDYRECCTLDSLLTSFFLHIYYSNIQKLSTASYLLRETVTTAHILRLHEPETYETLSHHEYQRRLRVFWILFVTERYNRPRGG